jgi:hypothetical protein
VCAEDGAATGTQLTCITGTKVQILMLLLLTRQSRAHCAQAADERPLSVYLLYWCKGTHTDAAAADATVKSTALKLLMNALFGRLSLSLSLSLAFCKHRGQQQQLNSPSVDA